MINANCNHKIIKNLFGKKTSGIEDIYLKIFMVRTYSFIPLYYTLVMIPLIVTSFSIFCRME